MLWDHQVKYEHLFHHHKLGTWLNYQGKEESFTAIKLSGNMRSPQIKRHVRVNENRYWQPSYECLFAHEHAVGSLDGKILNIPKLIASFRHYLFYSFRIECKLYGVEWLDVHLHWWLWQGEPGWTLSTFNPVWGCAVHLKIQKWKLKGLVCSFCSLSTVQPQNE